MRDLCRVLTKPKPYKMVLLRIVLSVIKLVFHSGCPTVPVVTRRGQLYLEYRLSLNPLPPICSSLSVRTAGTMA